MNRHMSASSPALKRPGASLACSCQGSDLALREVAQFHRGFARQLHTMFPSARLSHRRAMSLDREVNRQEEMMRLMPRPNTLGHVMTVIQPGRSPRRSVVTSVLAVTGLLILGQAGPAAKHPKHDENQIKFNMVRNGGLPAACVP